MAEAKKTSSVSPALAAIAGWLIPGAGYLLLKQRARGITIGITILVIFALGLLIGGMKVAAPEPAVIDSVSSLRSFVVNNPWYIAQVLTGPAGIICGKVAQDPVFLPSHAHSAEIGTLYTAIAGMLNLLAIIDSSYRAGKGETK